MFLQWMASSRYVLASTNTSSSCEDDILVPSRDFSRFHFLSDIFSLRQTLFWSRMNWKRRFRRVGAGSTVTVLHCWCQHPAGTMRQRRATDGHTARYQATICFTCGDHMDSFFIKGMHAYQDQSNYQSRCLIQIPKQCGDRNRASRTKR